MRDFLIINDVQQYLNPRIFGGGPWVHLATVKTPIRNIGGQIVPEKEYVCFKHKKNSKVYIEELDVTSPSIFKKIEDSNLWQDLCEFLTQKGILAFVTNKEYKIAKPKI